jgi:TonB family protein
MQEAVSGILADRAQQADGLSRMLIVSVVAHVALGAALWLTPGWRSSTPADLTTAMTISLGPEGADTGGMTSLAERAVQAIAKPDAPRTAPVPPATKAPEMTESTAKIAPRPRDVARPDPTSKSNTPTTGKEIAPGTARSVTGGVPFGQGLASSAGGGGTDVSTNLVGFCCPAYLSQMIQMIRGNWNQNTGTSGQSVVRYTVRRDGVLVNIELVRSSGQELLDIAARRAVINTRQLPPLPREFTEPSLTVDLTFDYDKRR